MKKIRMIVNVIMLAALCLCWSPKIFVDSVGAAGDWRGYAVYRNGVSGGSVYPTGFNDHAGIMATNTYTGTKPVVHANGSDPVKQDTWSNYLNGHSYLGVCRPSGCSMTSNQKSMFVALAKELIGIPYLVSTQMYYVVNNSNSLISPSQILNLRCDGVVEYVYEYYSYRVGGGDGVWDISVNNSSNYYAHFGANVTPRKQRQTYLAGFQSSLPQ